MLFAVCRVLFGTLDWLFFVFLYGNSFCALCAHPRCRGPRLGVVRLAKFSFTAVAIRFPRQGSSQ